MKNRFITQSSGSFFLFGPRGTGKSTWLEAALPEAYTVNLLLADVRRQLTGNPERLHSIVAEHPDKSVFVIDEIQRAPDLLDSVHDIMEKSPHLKFVLTGSSREGYGHAWRARCEADLPSVHGCRDGDGLQPG